MGSKACFSDLVTIYFLVPGNDRTDYETITLIITPLPDSSPPEAKPTRQHGNEWELALCTYPLCTTLLMLDDAFVNRIMVAGKTEQRGRCSEAPEKEVAYDNRPCFADIPHV